MEVAGRQIQAVGWAFQRFPVHLFQFLLSQYGYEGLSQTPFVYKRVVSNVNDTWLMEKINEK